MTLKTSSTSDADTVAGLSGLGVALGGAVVWTTHLLTSDWDLPPQPAAGISTAALLLVAGGFLWWMRRLLGRLGSASESADERASPTRSCPGSPGRRAVVLSVEEQVDLARPGSVAVLSLCESDFLVLHPDQLYRFRIAPGCARCADLARAGALPAPTSRPALTRGSR